MRVRFLEKGGNWLFEISNISTCICPLLSLKFAEHFACQIWILVMGNSLIHINCMTSTSALEQKILSHHSCWIFFVYGRGQKPNMSMYDETVLQNCGNQQCGRCCDFVGSFWGYSWWLRWLKHSWWWFKPALLHDLYPTNQWCHISSRCAGGNEQK